MSNPAFLDELINIIKDWIDRKKTGSIQINFFKGGISNIIKQESEKLGETK